MPQRKREYKIPHRAQKGKVWILYSSNREFCFLGELQRGYFGVSYRCGCSKCDPHLVLPDPRFTPPPGPAKAVQTET